MSTTWIITMMIVSCVVGFWLALILTAHKVSALQDQIDEIPDQIKRNCEECDYYIKYKALEKDCNALCEELDAVRRSRNYLKTVNRGLVQRAWRQA